MLNKYGEGKIKVGNTHLRAKNASYGVKNSWHKQAHPTWKNEDGTPMPMAFDLTPNKGYSFADLWKVLDKPEWRYWLASQDNGSGGKGWGVVDESTAAIRATHSWKATGNHIHLGAGSSAWKQYAAAMKKYNGSDIDIDTANFLKNYSSINPQGASQIEATSAQMTTPSGAQFQANKSITDKAVAQAKLGYYEHAHGGRSPITNKSHQNCTSGPATFYKAAGINLNGHWWKTADGKGYTWNGDGSAVDHTGIGEVGFGKIWNGSSDAAKTNQFASVLQPGDIGISFGMLKNGKKGIHAQMYVGKDENGKDIWYSDFNQPGAWVFGDGWKGDDSFQLWRYKG